MSNNMILYKWFGCKKQALEETDIIVIINDDFKS